MLRASSAATTGASPLKNVKLKLNESATPEKRMRVGKRSAAIAMTVPAQIAPTHFGVHGNVEDRREQLAERLAKLEARVRAALALGDEHDALDYEEEVREEISAHRPRELVDRYFDVFPAATDWAGVRRYIEKAQQKKG